MNKSKMKTVKPISKHSVRPFRIWDNAQKRNVRGRNYSDPKRALDSALIITRWSRVYLVYEVYDIRNGQQLGTFKRAMHNVEFTPVSTKYVPRS